MNKYRNNFFLANIPVQCGYTSVQYKRCKAHFSATVKAYNVDVYRKWKL